MFCVCVCVCVRACVRACVRVCVCAVYSFTKNDCPSGVPRDNYLFVHGTSCYYFVIQYARNYEEADESCRYDSIDSAPETAVHQQGHVSATVCVLSLIHI